MIHGTVHGIPPVPFLGGMEWMGRDFEGMSIQDQVDNLTVGVRACGAIGIGSVLR